MKKIVHKHNVTDSTVASSNDLLLFYLGIWLVQLQHQVLDALIDAGVGAAAWKGTNNQRAAIKHDSACGRKAYLLQWKKHLRLI